MHSLTFCVKQTAEVKNIPSEKEKNLFLKITFLLLSQPKAAVFILVFTVSHCAPANGPPAHRLAVKHC